MHRDQAKPPEQKGQEQRETVGVVQAGNQHEEQEERKPDAGARGKEIDSPPLQNQRQSVQPLAAAYPARRPALQPASEAGSSHRHEI